MSYLRWPKESVENYIDIKEFKGWRGKYWKQTKENAAKTAHRLLKVMSREDIHSQLGDAIRRIHKYQALSIAVLLADLAVPYFIGQAGYRVSELPDRLTIYALLGPPGMLATVNTMRLDRRGYFYREVTRSLDNSEHVGGGGG